MKKLILASGNGGKLREIQAILGRPGCAAQTQEEMPEFRQATGLDTAEAMPVEGRHPRCALLAEE